MSNPFVQGAVVRVVNRVVNLDGTRVPSEYRAGGEAFWIHEYMDMPEGFARIVIQQSMFKMDPVSNRAEYKLGCAKLGASEEPISRADTERVELVDRELLPPTRHKLQHVRIHNPIRRMDALNITDPRDGDGAFAGEFGTRK